MRAMRLSFVVAASVLLSCAPAQEPQPTAPASPASPAPEADALAWPANLPVYDHVVIVVEENKNYDEVIGQPDVPYINKLKAEGANFTRAFGEEHFSQGNYFWLFSGDNHDIGFTDQPPPAGSISASNLGQQLIAKGLSFKGYAESLPEIGSTVDTAGESPKYPGKSLYARKHVPWISFDNVPNGTTVETSSNLRFADFPDPSRYDELPTVAFVIPNLDNDMHNGPVEESVPAGDRWLEENLDSYYQWAKENNSLLIVTFDENNDRRGYQGLTNALVDPQQSEQTSKHLTPCVGDDVDPELFELCNDLQNRIVTIFAGAHVKAGETDEAITHVNILRTLEAMYGLPRSGAQQPNAAGGRVAADDYIITDVFEPVG